ncbi:hypothetical protein [Noviherbaspirillum malthae]|jgi:hypothetical protein|uniref:hypothetical protein n=1 Tax=Noviherbaspirillum malthae TaxID=1260987 RepID=UPI00188E205D|nr:hypothetical protein [Noviherbaspirillum malthae]
MSSIIEQAIAQKRKLKLYYAGYSRTVEPYAFGLDHEGQPLLLCFQEDTQGNTRRPNNWVFVHAHEPVSIKMLEDAFSRIQSGYIRNHPAFHTVLIQV